MGLHKTLAFEPEQSSAPGVPDIAGEQGSDPDQWVDRYGDYLYRFALSRLRETTAAEEVVQETFLAGIRHQQQFTGKGAERAWLLGILKRKIIDYYRRQSREPQQLAMEEQLDPTALFFDESGRWKKGVLPIFEMDLDAESEELYALVDKCLRKLPKGQAAVFVLSVLEEMDSQQICLELDITPANLWTRMHRARLGLAKCVGTQLGDGIRGRV